MNKEDEQYVNPDWDYYGRVHEWRNYIDDELRAIWDTFTEEQRIVIGRSAEKSASNEEWD